MLRKFSPPAFVRIVMKTIYRNAINVMNVMCALSARKNVHAVMKSAMSAAKGLVVMFVVYTARFAAIVSFEMYIAVR